MRPGRTGFAVLCSFLLVALPAAAENLSSLETTVGQVPALNPGEGGTVPVTVRYCYTAPPLRPANVEVAVTSAVPWLTATPQPSTFRADASGQRCSAKDVAVQFQLARGSPAFTPGTLTIAFTSSGLEKVEATAVAQATYWAELAAKAPRVRAARGDFTYANFEVTVGANAATKVEIVGNDPQRLLSLEGYERDFAGAGNGLDQRVTQNIRLGVTVSPGSELGVRTLPVTVSTQYKQGENQGESKPLTLEVEVVEAAGGNPVPGPALAVALAALAVGAAALRRRR